MATLGVPEPKQSWVPIPPASDFPLANLPYGVFARPGELHRVGVAIGEYVLDLAALSVAGIVERPEWFVAGSLNAFLAAGRGTWQANRARLTELLTDESQRAAVEPHLIPLSEVLLHLPFDVADYVDFYSSLEHASNLGRMLRPNAPPLLPNWRHLPVGYHGRSGTVVVTGTSIVRPCGQRKPLDGELPTYGPSERLDIEAEVGFVVGVPSELGTRVSTADFAEHVFGLVLLNDWSARDLQAWEYQPLGPFLGKSFATSISPWVVPLAALEAARIAGPDQLPPPLPYLQRTEAWGLDIWLEVRLNDQVISRPPFAGMYWTPDQQLAHLTVNGASIRTGDLYASGTVSGSDREQLGSLIELTGNGDRPLELWDTTRRTFLVDGDVVTIRASAPAPGGHRIGFGEVTGEIRPAE